MIDLNGTFDMKRISAIWLVLVATFLAGCVNWGGGPPVVEPASEDQEIDANHIDLVTMNLVYALSQLGEIRPRSTTVQFSEPRTAFGRTIEKRLVEAGYGLQRVSSDVGSNFVRYQYINSITESGPITRFTMSIGFVEATRNYVMRNGAILPDSEILISGAAEKTVAVNDEIFANQDVELPELLSQVVFESSTTPELVVLTPSGAILESGEQSGADVASNFAASVRRNIHDNNEVSNYASIFDDYFDVRNAVLIFPNDQLTVGVNNKKVIQSIAKDYKPETDVISVIGCSHGKTALASGNAGLATGRANRVKEELIFSNVPYNHIYEEGCWGSISHDDFPARGVLITLKRRNS